MLKPKVRTGPPPKPLDAAERQRVWRWERRMIWFYGIALNLLCGAIALLSQNLDNAPLRRAVLGLIVVLAAAGAYVQFGETCPRCGSRLGRQSRFVLPDACRVCGVDFPRPPKQPPAA
jgi:hypothetical protein